MSAAVKGKSVTEARDLIRTFKAMMSIHESASETSARRPAPATLEDKAEPEAIDVDALGELAALLEEVEFPVRIKCARLSRGIPWTRNSTRAWSTA